MDLLGLSLPLGLGIAALGSGLGLGKAVSGAMEAMGRQPEAIGQIQTAIRNQLLELGLTCVDPGQRGAQGRTGEARCGTFRGVRDPLAGPAPLAVDRRGRATGQ